MCSTASPRSIAYLPGACAPAQVQAISELQTQTFCHTWLTAKLSSCYWWRKKSNIVIIWICKTHWKHPSGMFNRCCYSLSLLVSHELITSSWLEVLLLGQWCQRCTVVCFSPRVVSHGVHAGEILLLSHQVSDNTRLLLWSIASCYNEVLSRHRVGDQT